MRTSLCVSMMVGMFLSFLAPAGATERVSLNGEWEVLRSESQSPEGLAGEFQKIMVPGVFDAQDRRFAWCRRTFTVPEQWSGRHVFLRFGGVRYAPVVYVNGREAGSYWGAWEPFEMDVTDLCKVGAENQVMLRISADVQPYLDAGIAFKPDWTLVQRIRDKVIVPMGFVFTSFAAIWDDVTLEARPDVYVDDVTVVTSVRQKTITVTAALRNLGKTARQVHVGAKAMDGQDAALDLGQKAASVEAASAVSVTFTTPWPDPKLWQPDSPHLYQMDVRLSVDGRELDSSRTRFGFRELWVDGTKLLLNGTRVNFLGTARPGLSELLTRDEVRRTLDNIRSANCRAVRLHANVWPQVWLDVADEIGMLIVEESSYWCCTDQYATDDPAFWDNFRAHWRGIIRRDKNHPSVVLYSIENELLLCAGPVVPENRRLWDLEKNLAEVGRFVKELDPTRPIMYDGDDDPRKVADIANLHYPHEPGRHQLWPNTAYWLDQPIVIDNYPRNEWTWDRSKPLYVGEFQYNTGGRAGTLFFGDEVYAHPELRDRAQGIGWRMQVEAFRAQGVAGMCPWTVWSAAQTFVRPQFEEVQKAYAPNAAIVREYDTRFYSGDEVKRTVNLYNDTMHAADLVLHWELKGGPAGEKTVTLAAGDHAEVPLVLAMPAVEQVTAAPLKLTVTSGGKAVYEAEHPYWVCPRRAPGLALAPGKRIAVLQGDGVAAQFLRRGGLEPVLVTDPALIAKSGADLLVVEAHALDRLVQAERVPVVGSQSGGPLVDFAVGGGRAIVLEQDVYPRDMVPARLTGRATNIAFARSQMGRQLAGDRAGWFQFWRGDHLVSYNTIAKPSQGASRVMVDAGSMGGLEDALLVEIPIGQGSIVLCQLAVSEKLDAEPAASLLLEGLVNEAGRAAATRKPLALLGMSDAVRTDLSALGAVTQDVTEGFATARLEDYGFVLAAAPLAADADHAPKLRDYVAHGGRVVLHGVPAAEQERLASLLGRRLTLGAAEQGQRPLIAEPDAITDGLANADLQRLSGGVVTPGADARLEALLQPASLVRATDGTGCWIIDQVEWDGRVAGSAPAARYVSALLANQGIVFRPTLGRLSIPGSDLIAEGAEASRTGEIVTLRGSGSLSAKLRCASEGNYVFAVLGGGGRGRGAAASRPQLRLLVDGVALQESPAGPGTQGALLTCRGHMTEGEHKVVLESTVAGEAPAGSGGLRVSALSVQPE